MTTTQLSAAGTDEPRVGASPSFYASFEAFLAGTHRPSAIERGAGDVTTVSALGQHRCSSGRNRLSASLLGLRRHAVA